MSKLKALREALAKEKEKQNNNGNNSKRNGYYPFWDMNPDERAVVRFLPDANDENPFQFYIEKSTHTLSLGNKKKTVPCIGMYGEKCPICDLSREFYKEEGNDSKNGKYYYRNKSSLIRAYIIEDPLPADATTGETYEGTVQILQINNKLMKTIKAQLADPELDEDVTPWDLTEGINYNIKKIQDAGQKYADYEAASGFARKVTSLPKSVQDEIELLDLQTLLPANPGYAYVKRVLDAHLNGTEVDDDEGEGQEPKASPKKAEQVVTSKKKAIVDDEDDMPPVKKVTKPTRQIVEEDENEDEDDDVPAPVKKVQTTKKVVELADDDEEDPDVTAILNRLRRKQQ